MGKITFEDFFPRIRGTIRPGAHRLMFLLQQFKEDDFYKIPSLLVTGTNGKGSTCATLESLLRHQGWKTGLYTSPHLVSPRERIRIGGECLGEEFLQELCQEVYDMAMTCLSDATFFELATAVAFLAFARNDVEVLVCEVGLGGRLDSTNLLSPLVSVLTGVSLEHTDYLGNTLESIALEKSYVGRRNRPLVRGDLPQEALKKICEQEEVIGFKLYEALEDQEMAFYWDQMAEKSLWMKAHEGNIKVALGAFKAFYKEIKKEFDDEKLKEGLLKVRWPGRMDIRLLQGRTVILDVAHNPGGVDFLCKHLEMFFPKEKFEVVFSSLNDKDWKASLEILRPFSKNIVCCPMETSRAVLKEEFEGEGFKVQNFEILWKSLFSQEDLSPILVTGSLAFVGKVFEFLGLPLFE